MYRHAWARLWLHTTAELEALLGDQIVARTELHAWPLSAVELLLTSSGEQLIYKVQHIPTVEAAFLSQAQSPLLPTCRVIQHDQEQTALLMPYIAAPTLRDQQLDEIDVVKQGRIIIQQIGSLQVPLPVYLDLGTVEAWRLFTYQTFNMLSALISHQIFNNIAKEELEWLSAWADSKPVLQKIDQTAQLINADLKAEHVFCHADSFQIIDWQRPYYAPAEIDLVLLLESLNISSRSHVAPAVIGIRWMLFLHWAVEAKTNLLPDLPFFDQWARQAIDQIQAIR